MLTVAFSPHENRVGSCDCQPSSNRSLLDLLFFRKERDSAHQCNSLRSCVPAEVHHALSKGGYIPNLYFGEGARRGIGLVGCEAIFGSGNDAVDIARVESGRVEVPMIEHRVLEQHE